MLSHKTTEAPSQVTSGGPDHSEEVIPDIDEPPDSQQPKCFWSSLGLRLPCNGYQKAKPALCDRRESMLTRQLQSETEHTEEEDAPPKLPSRGLSMISNWSNTSAPSTADLTSDDGKSMVSPAISPPLPPVSMRRSLSIQEKPLAQEPKIVGHDDATNQGKVAGSEQSIEAALGRRRCITFGAGPKEKPKPTSSPQTKETPAPSSPQPKRRCALKFVCPSRTTENKHAVDLKPKRPVSPPPPERRSAQKVSTKLHRDSDSTVTHVSPRSLRKPVNISPSTVVPIRRRFSNDSDDDEGAEATRFHEFGSIKDQLDDWTQQSGCHRSRLTVRDTLSKENHIRELTGEAEDEALEDEDDEAELDDEDAGSGVGEGDLDDEDDDEDDEESDEGFRSDDEQGFANSDSEDEASDDDWWRPGGHSTAATSAEHLEHFAARPLVERRVSDASTASGSSGHLSPHTSVTRPVDMPRNPRSRKAAHLAKPDASDLPDSTDFVCGTLDEDRPLEQAFINSIKKKQALRHKSVPQDIDPTFPTSDPELSDEDEEDDGDDDDADVVPMQPTESERDGLLHGEMEHLHGAPVKRKSDAHPHRKISHRSPPPPAARCKSPAPPRRPLQKSKSPPPSRRVSRSPAPAGLFGHSPHRLRFATPPMVSVNSPPNSRISSIAVMGRNVANHGLAHRPAPTKTESLPKNGVFPSGKMAPMGSDDDDDDDDGSETANNDLPKRRAIDIVKGLEKKRARRKEKLYQKHCQNAAKRGEKVHRVKPGKGCERMREVGLELQRYHGKATHILSL
ncbi:hypothetical protein K431DRAFT_223306 [Polychaeton citri CBS 116435]|uniref:Extensin domain-containing protein n=1 Tax=Polychaeton citri CBS 116435 TaxID=1314669 RepID=A0A9P4QBC7_9PEZI|nr:hypothetical protein K431DRAFT_223306 [Polychaeton citri CBS 116435]